MVLSKNPQKKPLTSKSNKGLGRGVDALFFNTDKQNSNDKITSLSITSIVTNKYQARKSFNDETISELAGSIKTNGVLQPIIVRRNPLENNYEIIAGERRLRAARLAGLNIIPSIIKELSNQDASLISLIENLQREDLNCIDEANGIKKLIDEFNLTHEKCSQLIHKSRSVVTNSLRLLELDNKVKNMIRDGLLDMSHARTLLGVDKSKQALVANSIIQNKLSVRKLEEITKKKNHNKNFNDRKLNEDNIDPEVTKIIEDLEEKFGLAIDLSLKRNNKNEKSVKNGYIKINFSDLDQLNHLLKLLKG